jgi:hypothetical protein
MNIAEGQRVPVRKLTGNNACEVEGQAVVGNAATNDGAVRSGRCLEGNEPGPDAEPRDTEPAAKDTGKVEGQAVGISKMTTR